MSGRFFLVYRSLHRFSVFRKYFLPVLYTSVFWQVFLSVYCLYFFIETVQTCKRADVQKSKGAIVYFRVFELIGQTV